MDNMRILVHIPSRSRPIQLAHALSEWERMASGNRQTGFLISLDKDDNSCAYFKSPTTLPTAIVHGVSKSKIDAINRDVGVPDWDVLIVASDDLVPLTHQWDDLVRKEFEAHFDNTDGVLWADDSFNKRICCHPFMGRTYYERFNHVFDNRFKSLYCDDLLTMQAKRLGKLKQIDSVKLKHLHYRNKARKRDTLDARNEAQMRADHEMLKHIVRTEMK